MNPRSSVNETEHSIISFVNFNDFDFTWNSSFWILGTVIIFISFRYLGYRIQNSTTLLCSIFSTLTLSYFTAIAIYFHFVLYPFLRYLKKNYSYRECKLYSYSLHFIEIAKLAILYLISIVTHCCVISIIIQTLSFVIRSNYFKFRIYMSLTFVILLIIVFIFFCLLQTMSLPESAI